MHSVILLRFLLRNTHTHLIKKQRQVVNRDYIQLLLRMGKTVVGVEAWNNRGNKSQGKLEEMLLITDEVLIAWTVDGHYNGWCDLYKTRYMKRDGKAKGRESLYEWKQTCDTHSNLMLLLLVAVVA